MRAAKVAAVAWILSAAPLAVAQATTVTGILTLRLTIKIASTVPASTQIRCTFSAKVNGYNADFTVSDLILESDTVNATRSGSTAVCTLTIPYEWVLLVAKSDTVDLTYSIAATGSDGRGRSVDNESFRTIAVPANGKTTGVAATARI